MYYLLAAGTKEILSIMQANLLLYPVTHVPLVFLFYPAWTDYTLYIHINTENKIHIAIPVGFL